jgi:hypothetical protein
LKAFLSIFLIILILAQNCGLVLYSFHHHHHCTEQNACATEKPNCIPVNDDCNIAEKVKEIGRQANNKENAKYFSFMEYIVVDDEYNFSNNESVFLETNKSFNGFVSDRLLSQVKNVPYPPPNC